MSLRHTALLLTLPIAFGVGAVSSEERRRAAALALGPSLSTLEEPTEKDVLKTLIDGKKKDWKRASLIVVGQVLFGVCVYFTIRSHPDANNWYQLFVNTLFVAVISYISLQDLLGNPNTVSRSSEGKIVPGYAQPLAYRVKIPLVLLSLSILPLAILSRKTPLVFPFASLTTLIFVFFFSRSTPANPSFSLRWIMFLFIAFEVITALIIGGLVLLFQSPLGDAIIAWSAEGSESDEKVEEKQLRNPYLQELVQDGMTSLQPMLYFGVLSWIIAGLYRLDLSLKRKRATLAAEVDATDDLARLPAIPPATAPAENASEKEKRKALSLVTGERIVLSSLAASFARQKTLTFQSSPVYFLTGIGTVVGLLAVLPLPLSFLVEADNKLGFYMAEIFATLLAPPVLAIVLTVVSLARGEAKEVWTYRETWGGVKPAPSSDPAKAKDESMQEKQEA